MKTIYNQFLMIVYSVHLFKIVVNKAFIHVIINGIDYFISEFDEEIRPSVFLKF